MVKNVMNIPLYSIFSGKNNHVVKKLQENIVKQLHSQEHTDIEPFRFLGFLFIYPNAYFSTFNCEDGATCI